MEALGQLIAYLFFGGIWVAVVFIICIVGVIYNLVKYPKESSILLKSIGSATLIVLLLDYLTKSLWLDLEEKIETSIIGIFGSLILILILSYLFDKYFSSKITKSSLPNGF